MNGPLDTQAPRPTARPPHVPPPLPPAARQVRPPPPPTSARPRAPSYSDLEETKPLPKVTRDSLKRIHALLESINKIRAASTAWQVAAGCAAVMAKTLDARGVLIHRYDEAARELRIIGVDGADTEELLGSVASVEDDFIAVNVLASGARMKVRVNGELPELSPRRLRALGASRSIVAVPIMGAGGCVAIVELVDVDEGCEPIISEVCELLSEQLLRVLSSSK